MRASNRQASIQNFQMVDVIFDSTTHQAVELINGEKLEDNNESDNISPVRSVSPDKPPRRNTSSTIRPQHKYENLHRTGSLPESFGTLVPSPGGLSTSSACPSLDPARGSSSKAVVAPYDIMSSPMVRNDQTGSQFVGADQLLDHNPLLSPDVRPLPGEQFLNDFADAELQALDYLTSYGTESIFVPPEDGQRDPPLWPTQETISEIDHPMEDSPDIYATYYPNAEYRELHATLHNRIVETARNTGLTRQCTPEQESTELGPSVGGSTTRPVTVAAHPGVDALLLGPSPKSLTPRRELQLWRNYFDEISVWLDMFDNERHFQHVLPLLAKTSRPLRLSVLALSARQMERKDPDRPYIESLGLYQEAIHLISQDLQSLDTAVIASCVLLCVLEMMSSSPRDWGRHLDGCAMLLEAAGINGSVGGMRQALFWCFARMDVWGGFLSETYTKIPTSLWGIQSGSMSAAVSQFKSRSTSFYGYANYAVFLCASVLNVITNQDDTSLGRATTSNERQSSYSTRWKALFELVQDWYNSRPPEMQPLMCDAPSEDSLGDPFPLVLYGNSPAVNGNQLYHASTLLMLQEKPKDVRLKGQRSILWHARQICGISASNHDHGPWINALQPLWISGKLMSHPTEHRIILDLLKRIEKETGWATSWRVQDLREYWGDVDD